MSKDEIKRIDLSQFKGITEGPWDMHYDESALDDQEHLEYGAQLTPVGTLNEMARVDAHAIGKVPDLIAELKKCYGLHDAILGTLSDYDINELIRDVPEDEWNFEQRALVRIKELIENKAPE